MRRRQRGPERREIEGWRSRVTMLMVSMRMVVPWRCSRRQMWTHGHAGRTVARSRVVQMMLLRLQMVRLLPTLIPELACRRSVRGLIVRQ